MILSRFEKVAEASVLHTLGASSDAYPVFLRTQQMFTDDDSDFEEAPCSLNFSNESWKGAPDIEEEGERCLCSSLPPFAVGANLEANLDLQRTPS